MDVREKLVELIDNIYLPMMDGPDTIGEYRIPYKFKREIADHLIANGVTVQEWIPASEPPKKYRDEYGELIPFLVCAEDTDYPFRAMYDGKTWGDGIFAIPVKWWMHLPEPHKEKERKDGYENV